MPISDIVQVLETSGVSYALIGGRAVIARGHLRATVDYDFLTTDKIVLSAAFWASLEDSEIEIRKGDFDDQFKGVVHIRLPDGRDTDVIVGKWKWEQAAINRAERMDVGGMNVPVPRVSDLILLKLAAGGGLDLQDIGNLMEVYGRDSLVAEVEARIDEVRPDVRETWTKLLAFLDV